MSTQPIEDDQFDDENDAQQQTPTQPTSRQLREAAKRAEKVTAENADLTRELAVWRAGLGSLSEKQIKALMAAHEGDLTPELLKATAVELAFIEAPENSDEQQLIESEIREQGRISQAASGAGKGSPTSQLTPEIVNGWPQDKQMRLLQDHPEVYERLLRGETVSGVPFI